MTPSSATGLEAAGVTPPDERASVKVRSLAFNRPLSGDSLSKAECVIGLYQAWTHHEANGQWFWALYPFGRGQAIAHGEAPDEAGCIVAAQADYEQRILSAIDVTALKQEIERLRGVLTEVIRAWEATKAGTTTVAEIQRWLIEDMKPAIDAARAIHSPETVE